MAPALRRLAAATILLAATTAPAFAEIPSIVVTPYYLPIAIGQSGSAVSVITRDEIEQSSPTSVAGLLKTVPGVTVTQSGGPGGLAEVHLRGGESGHTLVLIDGVRVNDPSTANDEFDFSAISPDTIERIEILRGPQSSIYGSDAMGGVVNIITRKPSGAPSLSATVEGGSYGTHVERLSGGFAKGDFSLLMSGEHVATSGFSNVGNRDHDEADGFDKWDGSISGRYAPVDGPRFEFGATGTTGRTDYDGSPGWGVDPANARNTADNTLVTGYGRLSFASPDGHVKQSLTGFATAAHRHNNEPGTPDQTYDFASNTVGGEYRATFGAGAFGQVLAGARLEQEQASYAATPSWSGDFDDTATRYALFAGDQISPIDHLFLTFSGRYDGQPGADGFLTGSFTAAYEIPATETKLRASLGTGAKRPTFFQTAYNLDNGVTTPLQSEESLGGDVGIDQALFDGRLTLSATAFLSGFTNLLNFDFSVGPGAYVNVGRANMKGVELEATAVLIPSRLTLAGSYTYTDARDATTGLLLARRPQHSGAATLTWTGHDGLEASLTATYVGNRFDGSGETTPMSAYTRFDLSASYPLNAHTRIFGRVENLTDVRYQDPAGYNTAGLSAYVGLTWRQ